MSFFISKRKTAELFEFSIRTASSIMANALNSVPDVEIDPEGVFKYILIKVFEKQGGASKMIVRGNKQGPYHADIYDECTPMIHKLGLATTCTGGGRIDHNATAKKILVYGYSQGYGKADHKIAVDLLKKHYTDYDITFSDEGY
uniref:Sex-regulated protein janus-A n=2 Tax=Clastoptera arizonana TaxID=38151 RepID=A0A1B6CYR7_9HEMI